MYAHTAAEEIEKERRRKRGRDPTANCRFCHRNFSRREARDTHEKNTCRHPGAPKHTHDELCKDDCPGAPEWVAAPRKPAGRKRGGE